MIILLMGVSGSGKSTVGRLLADTLGWTFCDADDLHPPANLEKMRQGIPLEDTDRMPWLQLLADRIDGWLLHGTDAVMACSALRESYRRMLVPDPTRVRVVHLTGDFSLIEARLRTRSGHFMPPALLRSQFEALEAPADAIVVDVALPPEEIVARIVGALGLEPPSISA